MSSLHDFVHHEMGAMPGPVPDPPPIGENSCKKDRSLAPKGSVSCNAKADSARQTGQLKGDLYYTQQEAEPTLEGWTETESTVRHKLISKELFPQG